MSSQSPSHSVYPSRSMSSSLQVPNQMAVPEGRGWLPLWYCSPTLPPESSIPQLWVPPSLGAASTWISMELDPS